MSNVNQEPKNWEGISLLPWFNDMIIYQGIKDIARSNHKRPYSIILTAVQSYYKEQTRSELNTTDVMVMHAQLRKAGQDKKTRADHVADYIEVCCGRYVADYFKGRIPSERG